MSTSTATVPVGTDLHGSRTSSSGLWVTQLLLAIALTVVLGLLATFVAWGRYRASPIPAR